MQFIKRNQSIKNPTLTSEISNKFGLPKVISNILIDRGVDSLQKVEHFLQPENGEFYDPFLMLDMDKAVLRLIQAVENNENVVIWGDYDCDGVTSSSLLYLALKQFGLQSAIYIPSRHEEGYGLSEKGIDVITNLSQPVDLLITVDCGITEKENVKRLTDSGIDVVVTDHHQPPSEENLPICHAVVNPHRENDPYPFPNLSGVGVALKLIQALGGIELAEQFYDLAALGTVADVMPIVDENRTIVARGLAQINGENTRLGFQAFKHEIKGDLSSDLTAQDFGFGIAPMINASGRLEHKNADFNGAEIGVQLFTSENPREVQQIVQELVRINKDRKEIEAGIVDMAQSKLEKSGVSKPRLIMIYGKQWEQGVVGLVASRLKEKYHCPALVMTYDEEENILHGSGRSIDGIDLYNLLNKYADHFESFGGHEMAAGFSLKPDQFQSLYDNLNQELYDLDANVFERTYEYDEVVSLNQIDGRFINSLSIFEPTGAGSPTPKFLLENSLMTQPQIIGEHKNHYRCQLKDETVSSGIQAIAFNQKVPRETKGIDVLFSPQFNHYNGNTTIQIRIDQVVPRPFNREDIQYNEKIDVFELSEFGVTDKKEKQFNRSKIHNSLELINLVPKRYDDYRTLTTVRENAGKDKEKVAILGKVMKVNTFRSMNGFNASCLDENGEWFNPTFFHQEYLLKQGKIVVGETYLFCGEWSESEGGFKNINPDFFVGTDQIEDGLILNPVYKKITGMADNYLQDKIDKAIYAMNDKDYLSREIIEKMNIVTYPEMIQKIHRPFDENDIEKGQRRLVFDKLFRFGLQLRMNEPEANKVGVKFKVFNMYKRITDQLPFQLTDDQQSIIQKMFHHTQEGNRLNALIQGDVGSGKSIVAFLMMFGMLENGYQSSMLAPTEVLARQHYDDLIELNDTLPKNLQANIVYLSGQTKAAERRSIYKGLSDGSVDMAIGTHALLSDKIEYQKLGLFIIDEEHRFGVAQREKINTLSRVPHYISMSATPIPRTLSMAMYNDDIQVLTIKQKPKGRQPIKTGVVESDEVINQFMLSEIKQGRQCYVICPSVSPSEDMKSVQEEVEKLEQWFAKHPDIKVKGISGKMRKTDINKNINEFKDNEVQVLVSTTIVEVGVNVPNASVMVLKNSDRFGLAQSHQLRGRVGRGKYNGYCILQPSKPDDEKAKILSKTNDGFEIAREDLRLRGTGDFIGTEQTGKNEEIPLMLNYPEFFNEIMNEVKTIIENPKQKELYKHLLDLEDNTLVK